MSPERMSSILRREALPVEVLLAVTAQQGRPHRDVAGVIAGEGAQVPGVQRSVRWPISLAHAQSRRRERKAAHIHTRAYRGSQGGYRRENTGLATRLASYGP